MNQKQIGILFLIILILSGVGARFMLLDKDFSCEETDFVKPAIAIKNTGKTLFYHSEQLQMEIALWHPPMYIYIMGTLFWIFSVDEWVARSINLFFSILTSIFIFLFCYKLLKKERGFFIGILASSLFLINYYVLSSSMLIDIDILSTFFVFGFVYFTLRKYQTESNLYLILSGVCLFFGLWNRYPMMMLTYLFIGIYFFFDKDFKKQFKGYFLSGIIVGILFVLIWTFYSVIIEPGTFFSFIFHNVKFGSSQFSDPLIYFGSFILNISQFIRLFTFPGAILMVLSFVYFLKKRTKFSNILCLYVLPIIILFFLVPRPAFGYPRYFMTVFPGVFILISVFLYLNLKNNPLSKREIFLGVCCFFISLFLLILFHPQSTFYESDGLIKATNLPDFLFNLFASIPLIFPIFLKKDKKRIFLIILFVLFLSYNFYFDFNLISNEPLIKKTANYLNEKTTERDIIIVPKAIGHYSKRKFYINENTKPKLDLSADYLIKYFSKSFENRELNDEFFWPKGVYSGLYPPQPNEEILNQASYVILYHPVKDSELEMKIGGFYIYNLR
ncbi:MAG: glycosyltransferase family 39 protein [Nanoarchaeota archaeon]|nr:glycosyltransferase family 39 protein [Nanoarchaeota archaeon]